MIPGPPHDLAGLEVLGTSSMVHRHSQNRGRFPGSCPTEQGPRRP